MSVVLLPAICLPKPQLRLNTEPRMTMRSSPLHFSDARPLGLRFLLLALILALMTLAGCAPGRMMAPAPILEPVDPLLDPAAPEMLGEAPALFKVLFETTAGDFVVEVERAWAPLGADRFHRLVRAGYYDGVRFFRVLPGFVVQFGLSGEPERNQVWREARLEDDPVVESNGRGTLSYAMAGPGSRTVQVFINLANNQRLDGDGFAPFGRITGGMDVVERLFAGYGEGAPRGQGPLQSRIQEEGETYLAQDFPDLDRIIRAWILHETEAEAQQPDEVDP